MNVFAFNKYMILSRNVIFSLTKIRSKKDTEL